MHVRLLEFLFWGSALFLVFLEFLGKNLRMHNLVHVRKPNYAYVSLFLCAQAAAQKP